MTGRASILAYILTLHTLRLLSCAPDDRRPLVDGRTAAADAGAMDEDETILAELSC